jgi:hypothetical protein
MMTMMISPIRMMTMMISRTQMMTMMIRPTQMMILRISNGGLLTEKIDHVVFLATDGDGNQLIIKVDKWEGSQLDPSAPEALFATLEAYLLEEYGTDCTITEYAIASGSYKDGSGGIFLSDGLARGTREN